MILMPPRFHEITPFPPLKKCREMEIHGEIPYVHSIYAKKKQLTFSTDTVLKSFVIIITLPYFIIS